ncbi:hypothetical protein GCM10018781_74740 [Kitasatospora indigofera]|uniref:Uncharacterized protein n=1 Tax=Kitasatospora indigofera TaxID=67307 RepID=A0A918YUL3_9ACTN|nr:hypothetical protein GCM10018781_74740 [Kitasatospora indigofera]
MRIGWIGKVVDSRPVGCRLLAVGKSMQSGRARGPPPRAGTAAGGPAAGVLAYPECPGCVTPAPGPALVK